MTFSSSAASEFQVRERAKTSSLFRDVVHIAELEQRPMPLLGKFDAAGTDLRG